MIASFMIERQFYTRGDDDLDLILAEGVAGLVRL